jgi:hypothetical protein
MDETCKQLIGEVQAPMAHAPERPARVDHEYVRNAVVQNDREGTCAEVSRAIRRRFIAILSAGKNLPCETDEIFTPRRGEIEAFLNTRIFEILQRSFIGIRRR